MAIIGLENNFYCAYTPIPVRVTPEMYPNMTFSVQKGFEVIGSGRMYQKDGVYYIDLSPWVKIGMHEFFDTRVYYKTWAFENINEQETDLTINFVEDDGLGGNTHVQSITKTFVKCALQGGRYVDANDRNVKMWRGFPYSFHIMYDRSSLYLLPSATTPPSVSAWQIEYETRICRGSYMKWLNEYGYYYYWLFPKGREEVDEAEEIYKVPRDIFEPYKGSNEWTVGYNATEKFTVRDVVKREYWHLFRSLVRSPEVYILNDAWVDTYLAGATTMGPEYWIKVRQTDVEFNRILYKRSMAELEFQFEYPRPYVQTLI
jgi:hypothetical protein